MVYTRKRNKPYNESYAIEINGKERLNKWLKKIGFSNKKHLTKIDVWKRLGYCLPNTSLEERYEILNHK